MALEIDIERGRKIASFLPGLFAREGLNGRSGMPEDSPPDGVTVGSLEHVLFITLTVAIDYQRDANQLWEAARISYQDPDIHYLFKPASFFELKQSIIEKDMAKYGLSRKFRRDPWYWRTNALTFFKKWSSDPRKFLESCTWNSLEVLQRLKTDTHSFNGRILKDFLYLPGPKIGPLWLRMMRDNARESRLKRLEQVPIPVDVHVARSTFALGIVRGEYEGTLTQAYHCVRRVWFEAVKGLRFNNRDMIALDMDQSLWHLSKYGCTKRSTATGVCPLDSRCDLRDYCILGKVSLSGNSISLATR